MNSGSLKIQIGHGGGGGSVIIKPPKPGLGFGFWDLGFWDLVWLGLGVAK